MTPTTSRFRSRESRCRKRSSASGGEMADDFFDTSALVKRHVIEAGSIWVRSLMRARSAHDPKPEYPMNRLLAAIPFVFPVFVAAQASAGPVKDDPPRITP